jgi:hypothetical protein
MHRRLTLTAVLATLWALAPPASANHSAPTGINCSNFSFQEDAQAYFEAHPGDPEGLDGPAGAGFTGIQNVACEDLPRRAVTTTTTVVTTTATSTLSTTTTTVGVPTKPTAILSGSSGQVVGELSSHCWPQGGIVVCAVVDYTEPGPDPQTTLAVTQGEVVTLRYEPPLVVATLNVAVWPGGPDNPALPATATNPSRFAVNLGPGKYIIGTSATFRDVPEGRLGHIFEIVVKAKAPVQPTRRIALAG